MLRNKEISMGFHPRAFAAFGSDLVTSDSVAVTELVKNSYDAYAYNAAVVFGTDDKLGKYIEIVDDGVGMTQDVVQNAWALIATPYKKDNPFIERNGRRRMVSGNKGLGRFSAARLGKKMTILTYNQLDVCFSVRLDWDEFLKADSFEACKVHLEDYDSKVLLNTISRYFGEEAESGTIIKIYDLNTEWNEEEFDALKLSLSRLISPFERVDDFTISLYLQEEEPKIIKIETQEFIKNPVYSIKGNVDTFGKIHWKYKYAPQKEPVRECKGEITWEEAWQGFGKTIRRFEDSNVEKYTCGSFTFEIRAWDLDKKSIGDIRDVFNIQKKTIRQIIAQYKGISVYRDDVLVLPKSDATKDWLGIDVRRISALGKRLSTSQMVGILYITQKDNPEIKDTTDREKLVDTVEYKQLCRATETIISVLENNRNIDKQKDATVDNPTLTDLLMPLSPTALESQVEFMVQQGNSSEDILDTIREYSANTEKNLSELNERLVYYAQAASLGSVSAVIMHEIRSGMTVIKRLLRQLRKNSFDWDPRTAEYLDDAETSHRRLLDVADSFAPMYRKGLPKEDNSSNVLKAAEKSIRLVSAGKDAKFVNFDVDVDPSYVAHMHEGELQTIFINLFDNACYWLKNKKGNKLIRVELTHLNNSVEVRVSDNGPGVVIENREIIFNPGVTSKPNGIGMGLVIITELLNNHKNTIRLETPGDLGGATFVFTLN